MIIGALYGCNKFTTEDFKGTEWGITTDPVKVKWEEGTMERVSTHSIRFIDSLRCIKKDIYNFSIPEHNGSATSNGIYEILNNEIKITFAYYYIILSPKGDILELKESDLKQDFIYLKKI